MNRLKTILKDEKYLRQKSKKVNLSDSNLTKDIKILAKYCKENNVMAMAAVQLGIPKRIIYLKNTNLSLINKEQQNDPSIDKNYTENHHIIGAKIAVELLKKEQVKSSVIKQIEKCILNHRGSKLMVKTTPEEICIADADAMAHFYAIPSLFRMVYVEKGLSIDDGAIFVLNKLKRSYNKLSKQGKKIIKSQYQSVKILLEKNNKI